MLTFNKYVITLCVDILHILAALKLKLLAVFFSLSDHVIFSSRIIKQVWGFLKYLLAIVSVPLKPVIDVTDFVDKIEILETIAVIWKRLLLKTTSVKVENFVPN